MSQDSRKNKEVVKNKLVQHYNKDDIIKNRIVNTDHRLLKSKKQIKGLPALSKPVEMEEVGYNYVEEKSNRKESFFPTEPLKNKRSQRGSGSQAGATRKFK